MFNMKRSTQVVGYVMATKCMSLRFLDVRLKLLCVFVLIESFNALLNG